MSRTQKAAIAAAFGYMQFGVALIIGIVMVPLMLERLGTRAWGLWLATGELLGYAAMVDLGVLGVLPWLLAEADGRNDRPAMRRLIANGTAVGALIGCTYAVLAVALWQVLPAMLRLTVADRALVGPPLAIVAGAIAIAYPFRIFSAALVGLQDTTFYGGMRVVQALLTATLTVVLLVNGYGLHALAWASALPTLLEPVASIARLRKVAPDLLRDWERPAIRDLFPLFSNGFGVWMGSFGWLLLSSSSALVIASLGHPEWVAVFACTAKTSVAATQLVWLLPDSGLVGLAQLYGEMKASDHVRRVVGVLHQLHLILAGAAACAVLAFNPAFVAAWVGEPLFGGVILNGLLALGIVTSSLVHGMVTTASVVGNRLQVGALSLANGLVQLGLAMMLARAIGLAGLPLSALIAAWLTSAPAGLYLLNRAIGLSPRGLIADRIWPWLVRAAPVAAGALLVGASQRWLGLWLSGLATGAVLSAYFWQMRPLYSEALMLRPGWVRWLSLVRLAPPLPADSAPVVVPAVNQS